MPPQMSTNRDPWVEVMQQHGFRNTIPCKTVMRVLQSSQKALSPCEIYTIGRRELPRLGLATVYRTLEKLESLALIERVHQPGGCSLYLRATTGHEHLLICTSCRRVEYFSGDNLRQLEHGVSQQSGFSIQSHWLQFNGLCATCQKAS